MTIQILIRCSDAKTSEEDREWRLVEARARQKLGTIPSREASNRRKTDFQRTAHSATSNPTEESSQARTQPWTLGHLNKTKTKQLLKEKYWFPLMNSMIDAAINATSVTNFK